MIREFIDNAIDRVIDDAEQQKLSYAEIRDKLKFEIQQEFDYEDSYYLE